MFTNKDLEQIQIKEIPVEEVERQIQSFITGFPPMTLVRAATREYGVIVLDDRQINDLVTLYEREIKKLTAVKFVPASGAASRMFQSLYEFMNEWMGEKNQQEGLNSNEELKVFFNRISEFAFCEELNTLLKYEGSSVNQLLQEGKYAELLSYILTSRGLNYGILPKGLLLFHRYNEGPRMPIEEHMVEGAMYAKNKNGDVWIHFTISPDHREVFKKYVEAKTSKYEKLFNATYDIEFSTQKKSTDTIAVTPDNTPFREENDSLLFRPAGHGAILSNLNALDADIVFIKNIDNVVPDRLKEETYKYKKVLGGVLLTLQKKIFSWLRGMEQSEPEEEMLDEIEKFMLNELSFSAHTEFASLEERASYFFQKLNRPIRVCGMVINQGEAGGGPFITENPDGSHSLQIVESTQIDINDPGQREIMQSSTHFNPVDLVCGVKNYRGEKFNLMKYTDPKTGFISSKSKDGKALKAMELPGLWNGSMSDWNTVFVEVPLITFNPVKTVNDLLRKEHC